MKANALRVTLLLGLTFFLYGCSGGGSGGDAAAEGPSAEGDYSLCTYDGNLSSSGYSSARVSYPCELDGPYAATTLTGGFTNTKEQMYWLADHLTTHGYIVITMTPTNRFGSPPVWATAHASGVEELLEESLRAGSPIYGQLQGDKIGIMGFSMGGGGALLASAMLGDEIETTLALAPYLGDHEPNYMAIGSQTLVLGGSEDGTSTPASVGSYYESLPTDIARGIAMYRGATHLDWIDSGSKHNKFETLITSWMKVYLDGDTSYLTYLNGAEHDEHLAEDWFTRYDYRP